MISLIMMIYGIVYTLNEFLGKFMETNGNE